MSHEELVQKYCDYAINILGVKDVRFRPMRRKVGPVNTKNGYVIGRTNLKTGLITIDIFTPKKREPKKVSSILNTLSHEIAHHQKKPFKQIFRGRMITRQHYPEFYKQVTENLNILKKDRVLKQFFE